MIQRSIHYKSDFKLRLANEIDWSTPFKLRFFTTRPVSAMEVSYDGTTYKGCSVDTEGKLVVTFDRFTQLHRQGLGNLMMELSYNIDDDQFADRSFDRILAPQKVVCIDDEDNEFELVLGLNGDSHVEVECSVIAAYKKGDPGDTPEIGENGNWWIGGVDTEVKADYSSEEALRQSQEAARVAAETTRQSNETQRQSGETTRQSNEATRQSKETERQTNETARQNAEAQRQQTFQTNEAARQTAYQNAEANRNGAYQEAEQDRDEEFASKEATRDAANEAALNCAETLAALGPKCDQNTTNIANLQQEIDEIEPIVINGDVTNAPDEEDVTTDSNNLLKLKNRSTAINQKGYKILRNGMSLASQMADANTIYEVRYAFDLNGEVLTIPSGCTLKFNGGSVSNGNIIFNDTILIGIPQFNGCTYTGLIKYDSLDDNNFSSSNYLNLLSFLLINAINNGCRLDIWHDYEINTEGHRLATMSGVDSGATLDFHGHTLTNTYDYMDGLSEDQVFHESLIQLTNCRNITICNLNFIDTIPRLSYANKSCGYNIVSTFGDCDAIHLIKCSQINGDGLLRAGIYGYSILYNGHIGLTNSKIIDCYAEQVGYGVTIYQGSNITILNLQVKDVGRGSYFAALSNSHIDMRCDNPQRTGVCCLLGDGIYLGDSNEKRIKGCSNLDINVSAENVVLSGGVVAFSSNGTIDDFSDRESYCVHEHIRISVKADSNTQGERVILVLGSYGSGFRYINDVDIHDCYANLPNYTYKYILFGGALVANISGKISNVHSSDNSTPKGFRLFFGGSCEGSINVKDSEIQSIAGDETPSTKFVGNIVVDIDKLQDTTTVSYPNDSTLRVIADESVGIGNYARDWMTKIDLSPYSIQETKSIRLSEFKSLFAPITGANAKCIRIYHNINLGGETINVQGAILDFRGGKLSNGTLAYANEGLMLIGRVSLDNVSLPATTYNYGSSNPSTYQFKGRAFYRTDLNKQVFYDGTKWIESDCEDAGITRSGTFASKPTTPTNTGFQYFCTSGASIDGGTTEKTNIVIYYTGSGWVDANGNAVVAKA